MWSLDRLATRPAEIDDFAPHAAQGRQRFARLAPERPRSLAVLPSGGNLLAALIGRGKLLSVLPYLAASRGGVFAFWERDATAGAARPIQRYRGQGAPGVFCRPRIGLFRHGVTADAMSDRHRETVRSFREQAARCRGLADGVWDTEVQRRLLYWPQSWTNAPTPRKSAPGAVADPPRSRR